MCYKELISEHLVAMARLVGREIEKVTCSKGFKAYSRPHFMILDDNNRSRPLTRLMLARTSRHALHTQLDLAHRRLPFHPRTIHGLPTRVALVLKHSILVSRFLPVTRVCLLATAP